jgi:hypothetical protein
MTSVTLAFRVASACAWRRARSARAARRRARAASDSDLTTRPALAPFSRPCQLKWNTSHEVTLKATGWLEHHFNVNVYKCIY